MALLAGACGEADPARSVAPDVAGGQPNPTPCFVPVGSMGPNESVIFEATMAGDLGRLESAVEDGGKLDARDRLDRTPLFAAASCNQAPSVAFLARHGVDPNARDAVGLTPLHTAVIMGSGKAVTALVDAGAKLDVRTPGGRTPLHLAAATGQVDLVYRLLARGANQGLLDRDGNAPAQLANRNGHSAAAAALQKARDSRRTPPAG
ncbi:MAG: ankyrin repeat domain-containing protein [Rhodocyclaceae bacterium]|nr:ankyrin repeat domain-containing protein [Rhodocyclaceae bacterium]